MYSTLLIISFGTATAFSFTAKDTTVLPPTKTYEELQANQANLAIVVFGIFAVIEMLILTCCCGPLMGRIALIQWILVVALVVYREFVVME